MEDDFYFDPTHSNTYFLKVGKWRVLLQGTVDTTTYHKLIRTCISCQIEVVKRKLDLYWPHVNLAMMVLPHSHDAFILSSFMCILFCALKAISHYSPVASLVTYSSVH